VKLRETTYCPNCERLAQRFVQQDAETAALKAQARAQIAQLKRQFTAARKYFRLLIL
jgi:uncharacterized Zn finger protein (UPF0148 family)